MNKTVKIIIIAVLAAILLSAGVFYAFNNSREQRMAREYLRGWGVPEAYMDEVMKQMSGKDITAIAKGVVGVGGIMSGFLGTGNMALPEISNTTTVSAEILKTQEQLYDETKAIVPKDNIGRIAVNAVKLWMEEVFEKAKLTVISGGQTFGAGWTSSVLVYFVPRKIQAEDAGLITKALQEKWWRVMDNGINGNKGSIMAARGENEQLIISFEINSQEIGVMYYRTATK